MRGMRGAKEASSASKSLTPTCQKPGSARAGTVVAVKVWHPGVTVLMQRDMVSTLKPYKGDTLSLARTRAGTVVAVKVRHPGVGRAIQRDMVSTLKPYKGDTPSLAPTRAGTVVAVKVRHPGVGRAIQRDFALMLRVARLLSLLPATRHLRLEQSLAQFAAPLREQARPAGPSQGFQGVGLHCLLRWTVDWRSLPRRCASRCARRGPVQGFRACTACSDGAEPGAVCRAAERAGAPAGALSGFPGVHC